MSPLDRPVPPTGEEIHLPGGSLQPILLTAGITVLLIGVTFHVSLVIAGGILTVAVLVRWAMDARAELEHLPSEHGEHH